MCPSIGTEPGAAALAAALRAGEPTGRDALVLSQGAWSCQLRRALGRYLYLRTYHDGYHPHRSDEMLFDIVTDPEVDDLASTEPALVAEAATRLETWTGEQLELALGDLGDPMDIVLAEGGPYHVRGHLRGLERLRATGRGAWADVLIERHP
ncbi:MAG: hypothetical protein R2695_18375 [Acidimicrobiales bacterium]